MRRAILACAIVLGAALAAYAAVGNGDVVATPPVTIVHTAGGSGSANATLQNTSAGGFNVAIVRDVSCDPAVDFAVAPNPFVLGAMVQKTVELDCAAAMPGMQRCLLHATNANTGDALADLLAVCEYAASSSLAPTTNTLAFGSVAVGDTGTMALGVTNSSSTTITKLFVQTDDLDGDFVISLPCNPDAPYCNGAISPITMGGSTTVIVKCSPQSVGAHTAQLAIATDTSQSLAQSVTLTCTGTVAAVPVLGVTPATIVVADRVEVIGATAQTAVHLENLGTGSLQITDLHAVDVDTGAAIDWTFTLSGTCTDTPCALAAGQQVAVNLTFDPSAIGARYASLLISFHDTVDRTRSIPLSAIGQGATLELFGGNQLLDFGTVPLGHTSQLELQFANHGNRDTLAQFALMPSGAPFSLNPSVAANVMPGSPTMLTASCAPSSLGTGSTTITVHSDDAFNSVPISIAATCETTSSPLYASPTSIALGEVRIGSPVVTHVQVLATGAPLTLAGPPALDVQNPNVAVSIAQGQTPATFDVTVDPHTEGDVAVHAVVSDTNGDTLKIPITARVVTPSFTVPDTLDLGTFCVNQPTASSNVALTSNGTATLRLGAPALGASSSFDLALTSPTEYPALIPAGQAATIAVTPQRQPGATTITDTVTWTTDVAGSLTATTAISATFISSGGAIAPTLLDFGNEPVHLFVDDGQRVMIQNCNASVLELDPPTIKSPFSIDSPNFPTKLDPNETATFSIGFHPTRVGPFTGMLTITSQQLTTPLQVALVGTSTAPTPTTDAGSATYEPGHASFYGCSCNTSGPDGGWPIVFALAAIVIPWRRRCGSSSAR